MSEIGVVWGSIGLSWIQRGAAYRIARWQLRLRFLTRGNDRKSVIYLYLVSYSHRLACVKTLTFGHGRNFQICRLDLNFPFSLFWFVLRANHSKPIIIIYLVSHFCPMSERVFTPFSISVAGTCWLAFLLFFLVPILISSNKE